MKPQIIERYVYPKGTPISKLPHYTRSIDPNMNIPVERDGDNERITIQDIDEYIADTHNYLTIEDKNELEQKIESIEITGDPNGVTIDTAQTITGQKTFATNTMFKVAPQCSGEPYFNNSLTNKEYVDDAIEKALSDIDVPSNITQQLETIQQDITEVKQDITTAEGEISNVKSKVTNVESDINEINQDITNINNELDDKQDILVSGTSIKTVNGQSLLGSGNIQIETPEGGITDAPTDGKLYGRKSGAWSEVKQDFLTSADKDELNSAIQEANDNISEHVTTLSKKDSELEGEIAQVGETVIGQLNNYLPLTGGTLTGDLKRKIYATTATANLYAVLSKYPDDDLTADRTSFIGQSTFPYGNAGEKLGLAFDQNSYKIYKVNDQAGATKLSELIDSTNYQTVIGDTYTTTESIESNYLPLTGGTITGNLTVNGNVNNTKLVHTDITGGLNVVQVSQSEYNSGSKDNNTLYIIVD